MMFTHIAALLFLYRVDNILFFRKIYRITDMRIINLTADVRTAEQLSAFFRIFEFIIVEFSLYKEIRAAGSFQSWPFLWLML